MMAEDFVIFHRMHGNLKLNKTKTEKDQIHTVAVGLISNIEHRSLLPYRLQIINKSLSVIKLLRKKNIYNCTLNSFHIKKMVS